MSQPYIPNDKFAKQARHEKFRARSVYKLQELDEKFRLLAPGMHVLDIGAAPGSWLQYTSQKITPGGRVLGLDLQEIIPIARKNVTTRVCDITDLSAVNTILKSLHWADIDLILSDIAPFTSGIAERDHGISIELNRNIFELSKMFLKKNGKLVMKVFDGKHFQDFIKDLRKFFRNVQITKVHATRERSKEVYVICR